MHYLKYKCFYTETIISVLFQEYQRSLGESGEQLSASIALLEKTSVLVEFFGDLRPIRCSDDPRLVPLQAAAKWFEDWEAAVMNCDKMKTTAEKKAALMTEETRDDTMSILDGFISMVSNHFRVSSISIIPGRVNSDVVENIFCQQRALVHGANDNPTHQDYLNGLNTIILSQAPISRKSNAFGSCDPAIFHSDIPLQKKPRLS